MSVLVTGGAGYIGAHIVRLLAAQDRSVVVVDDLSSGIAERAGAAPLIELDLTATDATERLSAAMREHEVTEVVHIAAKKQVGESVARPTYYWQQNVGGMVNLLAAMESTGVDRLVFSSSAATYGIPDVDQGALIGEDATPKPINPYGESKLVNEWMARAAGVAWGLRTVNLRYFNVAGAGARDLGDPGVFNLIPMAMQRLTRGEQPQIFGDDYPTPDGTCVRDYVHILDLADAHVVALDYLERAERPHDTFNVGTGTGASVREVLNVMAAETGLPVDPKVVDRRAGDPDTLVADVSRIADVFDWKATHDLPAMVSSAWDAWGDKP